MLDILNSCLMHMYYFQFAKKDQRWRMQNFSIVDKPFFLYIYIYIYIYMTINHHLRDFRVIILLLRVV